VILCFLHEHKNTQMAQMNADKRHLCASEPSVVEKSRLWYEGEWGRGLPVVVVFETDDAIVDDFLDFVENHLTVDVRHDECLGTCLAVGVVLVERIGVFEHPLGVVLLGCAVLSADFADESASTGFLHVVVAQQEMHLDALVLDVNTDEGMYADDVAVHASDVVSHVVEVAFGDNHLLGLAVGDDFRLLVAECLCEPFVEQFVELVGILATALDDA